MSNNLSDLVIDTLDEFNDLQELYQLLLVAIDQPPKKMEVLLKSYMVQTEPVLEKIDNQLHLMQKLIIPNEYQQSKF